MKVLNKNSKKMLLLVVIAFLSRYFLWRSTTDCVKKHRTYKNKQINLQPLIQKIKESSERTNRNSPFYGIKHRKTDGLPIRYFDIPSFEIVYEDWKKYFPKTFAALASHEISNPAQDDNLYTHAFDITLRKYNFTLGEEFVAAIRSVDGKGNSKEFGGDYYRARLITKNTNYPDGIPCRVIDNENGSYTVKAPLVMKGIFYLDVTLVISLEGISQILNETHHIPTWNYPFSSRLVTGETMLCDMNLSSLQLSKNSTLCDYSSPRNHEPWFCMPPSSGRCLEIIWYDKAKIKIDEFDFTKVCSKYGCYQTRQMHPIRVHSESDKRYEKVRDLSLSFCKNEFRDSHSDKRITGFFHNGEWRSIGCKDKYLFLEDTTECFKNTVFYFIGDSTIRQFFDLAATALDLTIQIAAGFCHEQQPKVAFDLNLKKGNVTLYHREHGMPLQNSGPSYTRTYISDTIIDIPVGGKGVYVVFNIGAHMYQYDPRIYLHRLKGIKQAIAIHHRKNPETKFIVRGLNVLKSVTGIRAFEWFIYRCEVLLHETFRNLTNVMFLNVWDTTTMWPLLENYHPNPKLLNQQGVLLFRNICS